MSDIKKLIEKLEMYDKCGLDPEDLEATSFEDLEAEIDGQINQHFDDDKLPETDNKYVGIEIECFSKHSKSDLIRGLYKHDLHQCVNITGDASIQCDYPYTGYEFNILVLEDEVSEVLENVQKFLKEISAQINNSCAIHVHLDMRNRNKEVCFRKLKKTQKLLFALVRTDRQTNRYCPYTTKQNAHLHRTAISTYPYDNLKTIEIRLLEGTLDMQKVENWTKLLIAVIDRGEKRGEVVTPHDLTIKLPRGVRKYVKDTYRKLAANRLEYFQQQDEIG